MAELTREEIGTLLLAPAHPLLSDLGWEDRFRGAALKLACALTKSTGPRAQSVQGGVLLDSSPWEETEHAAPHLQTLHEGITRQLRVDVCFVRARDVEIRRTISPLGLVGKESSWYLVWGDGAGVVHIDPVARVRCASLTEVRFSAPSTFDLQAVWMSWCRRRSKRKQQYVVQIAFDPGATHYVRAHLGHRFNPLSAVSQRDGRLRAQAVFEWIEEARAELLRLGPAVEVLEPAPLRYAIASHAEHTLALYRRAG